MRSSQGYKTASDGAKLFTRRWEPDGEPLATLCLVHGLGEHSGRYADLAGRFCDASYCLSAVDLRGHGKSEGARGDARFGPVLRDLDEWLEDERRRGPDRPIFFYGHSLGGLLVLTHLIDRKPDVAGAVASAAALHTALRDQWLKVFLVRRLGSYLPSIRIPSGLDDTLLTRLPEVLADYRADPLVHDHASLGFALDALDAIDRVLRDAGEIRVPVLLIHGAADKLNRPSGSQVVAEKLGHRCSLHLYEGVFHQPHTDPDTPRIAADVLGWLRRHCQPG